MIPNKHEMVKLLEHHYGLGQSAVLEILNTPTHPKTIRDEFAMAALNGLTAQDVAMHTINPKTYAKKAYQLADAMLEERIS